MDEEVDVDMSDMLTESEIEEEVETPTPTTAAGKYKGKKNASKKCSKKGTKKRKRSTVWKHFTESKTKVNKCNCHYCGKEMSCASSSGTSNLKKHIACCKQYQAFRATRKSSQKVVDQDSDGVHLSKVSEATFREACGEMLVIGELPSSFIDGLAFRHFCNKMKLYKPHSGKTATRDIVQMYAKRKTMMKKILGGNKQRFSLTTDIWVAPTTGSSYMVVTAHFIDTNWQLKKLIIGFKNVCDDKGVTIAATLQECLEEWDIKKIFSITVDNATANSNALEIFKEDFGQIEDDSLVLKGEFLHLRCATNILNLVVRDGTHEVHKSVAAIRNVIQYVRSSTPRLKFFLK